ncbi:hypothetical protein CAEBREN_00351 [Caenorhabditis brenneri]|uniref:SPK domain-containing protein n=1 Tax=Caenorhabditis brenneri TaxID=135651 RepID=G0MFW1_CAEBE|nr:hypothetical protein CAEBREN_00351 [Caenorhabditis brenneri]
MSEAFSKRWTTDPDYIDLLNFLIDKTENVKPPMNLLQLAREFKGKNGGAGTVNCLKHRIVTVRTKIHCFEHIDTNTKVKLLFALSSTVNADFLNELNKDAVVKFDDKKRITYYKPNDGNLELRGAHSQPAKRNHGKLIIDYFEKKNNGVPKDEEEKEMGNLIEFITEKCENIDSPLNIRQLSKDFNNHFGISRAFSCIHKKIKRYCHEIQKTEFLDTPSKVKQLFGLSARLDWDYLEKLRKDAVVEVDDLIRIKKYASNNGLLTLHGDHSRSAKYKLAWIESEKKRKTVKNYCNSGDEDEESKKEDGYSEEESDEYSSEEFDSEFYSDYENNYPDEPEDYVKTSKESDDFDDGTPIRNRSPTEISIADNLDFGTPNEKSHRTEEIKMGGDEKNDPGILGNKSVKTRYGRLSKRRHLDSEFSYGLASSRSSEAPASFESASSKPAKQKKIAIEKEQASSSSNQSRSSSKSIRRYSEDSSFPSFSKESGESIENQEDPRAEDNSSDYHSPRIQEIEDYDYNPREDNTPESSSTDNRLGEPELSAAEDPDPNNDTQNTDNRSNAVAPELHPKKGSLAHQNETNSTPPTNEKEVISQEVPVKVENGEPIKVKDHPEDVKPEIAHNFKIKFFEAMKSLILFLDTPSLSDLKTKIYQKIRKVKRSNGVLQNNELIPALELLIARMANHSVMNISGSVESVSLIQFFCYLKASILNSKMIGVEGLLNKISGLIEKSQNKRISMVKVANALRATLDVDSF